MTLNQKETGLLKDLKDQEQLCVEKYKKHAECACDASLKSLFGYFQQNEQAHLNTLTQIGNGSIPSMDSGNKPVKPDITNSACRCSAEQNATDKYLCSDALAGEKHVSTLYDTCIFEFRDPQIRNILNHIQKEEQEHGKELFDYMNLNGMYN